MIDTLEKVTIQDLVFANALGVEKSEVEKVNLFRMKNEMFNLAFNMRDKNQVISEEKANELNHRLYEIIDMLMEHGYEPLEDYIIDFNSFVTDNENYNKFCWQ